MSEERANYITADTIEKVLITGDLGALSAQERLAYYKAVCESLGLNPLTRPFDYIELNDGRGGKRLTLYARREATEQLSKLHGISITDLKREITPGLCIVTAYGQDANGRTGVATGAVALEREAGEWKTSPSGKRYFESSGEWTPLRGNDLANAIMTAETKAKRRLVLSLCGLGFLDETEAPTIPGAALVDGEAIDQPPTQPPAAKPRAVAAPKQDKQDDITAFWAFIKEHNISKEEAEVHLADAGRNFGKALDNVRRLYSDTNATAGAS